MNPEGKDELMSFSRRQFLALSGAAAAAGAAVPLSAGEASPPSAGEASAGRIRASTRPVDASTRPVDASTRPPVVVAPFNPADWKRVFVTDFPVNVPLGHFPKAVAGEWGAYSYGSPDTATERGLAVGGIYDPGTTTWISNGQLHVRQWRSIHGGPVHCSTPYPLAANGVMYGRFIETSRVAHPNVGYKSAHMLWGGTSALQDNWPENNWAGFHDTPHAFFHYGASGGGKHQLNFDSHARWTDWHTYEIRWQPGRLAAYIDDRLIGGTTQHGIVPTHALRWRLQNESSIVGAFAKPGTWAQIDTSHVEYWSWSG
jgi:hypothetical protein